MKKGRKHIVWIVILSFCFQIVGLAANGEAAQETISITEFYNNGIFGEGFGKALSGAVVTISNLKEMQIFLRCLENEIWTNGISFRQEADISFSDCTFIYDEEKEMIGIYSGDKLLGVSDRVGNLFRNYSGVMKTSIDEMGLTDAYFERDKQKQLFAGEYDGQGYRISGFILSGTDTRYSGFFGCLVYDAKIYNICIKNSFLLNACGTFAGANEGEMVNCSAESIVGLSFWVGGIVESNFGTMLRCNLRESVLVSSGIYPDYGLRLGGIAGSIYDGQILECAVENTKIFSYNNADTYAGGIVGYQTVGKIANCESFFSCSLPQRGKRYIAGGIVGYIESMAKSEVYNCISAGTVAGRIVGGVVGEANLMAEEYIQPAEVLIKNSVSLSKIEGNIVGGLVGELDAGKISTCYYFNAMMNGEAIGLNISEEEEDCYAVNRMQIFGEPSAEIIDSSNLYSNTTMLLDALNVWVDTVGGFTKWKAGTLGYPVLALELQKAPAGDYELGSEVSISPPGAPEASASPTPSAPIVTPAPTPTESPSVTASPTPSLAPASTVSPAPTLPSSGQNQEENTVSQKQLTVRDLKISLTDSLQVKLTWSNNKWADGYQILRSAKKSSGYKALAKKSKLSYIDKKAKPGQTYYYMVRAYGNNTGKIIYGTGTKEKIQVAWYRAPVIHLSKGVTSGGTAYVQVQIKKYFSPYVEVYFKAGGKTYVKAPLKNKKISSYKGKLKFSYRHKSIIYCKIRTYQIKNGKKRYSVFSGEKGIWL